MFNPLKSITLKGAAVAVGGYLWAHFDPAGLGQHGGAIVEVLGTLISVFGIRRRLEGPTPASGR